MAWAGSLGPGAINLFCVPRAGGKGGGCFGEEDLVLLSDRGFS